MLTNLFINGCSFLTPRPKDGVHTHSGLELATLMDLKVATNLAMGGRGNERISFTTKFINFSSIITCLSERFFTIKTFINSSSGSFIFASRQFFDREIKSFNYRGWTRREIN